MESAQVAEVIYLFVDGQVAAEITFAEFEQHIARQTPIPDAPPSSSVCRAGYVAIGPELRVLGLVFFLLRVDDLGRPDKNFNVPLPYLAKNAGPGPDLGTGPVPMACRGSCSVPWHANNLWDPTHNSAANPIEALAAAVANNRLELNPCALHEADESGDDVLLPGSADAGAMVADLSAQHTKQLMVLQQQHEDELHAQRESLEAKVKLYRQEVTRLRNALALEQQATSAIQNVASRSD